MKLLIVEPHSIGHHASYLHWLLLSARRKGWSAVVATTDGALKHSVFASIESNFPDASVISMGKWAGKPNAGMGYIDLSRRELAYWRLFELVGKQVLASGQIDAVILPYVDYCFHAIAILGSPFHEIPWSGISMRLGLTGINLASRRAIPFKWRLCRSILAKQSARALFVINPSVRDVPAKWLTPSARSKLHYLEDPAECEINGERDRTRAALGITYAQVAVLVFGFLDERKGIETLMHAVSASGDLSSYVVILAGQQSAGVRMLMSMPRYLKLRERGQVIIQDRYLTDSDKGKIVAAADVMWLGYQNHSYMSGVLVLGGRAGLPAVGTDQGEIGWLIRTHGLGESCKINELAEVVDALRKMSDSRVRGEAGERARKLFATHTVENFGDRVLQSLT